MKNWALILLFTAGLGASVVLADDLSPATLPAEAGRPATNGLATEPAVSRPVDALAGPETSPSTEPTTAPVAATGPTTIPTTSPVATTGPTTAPTTSPVAGGLSPDELKANQLQVSSILTTTTAPTTGPAAPEPAFVVPTSRILPREYAILVERSIFQKGSHVTRGEPSKPRPGSSGAPTTPVATPPKSAAIEESLVFVGATESGDRFLAFVEDRTTSKVLMVQNGDAIARGKVAAISLDSLDYAADGKLVHVQVGQNLRGETAAPANPTESASVAPTTEPSAGAGAPPGPAGIPGTPAPSAGGAQRLPGEDMTQYLQRRRREGR